MNIRRLRDDLSRFTELLPIGRGAVIDGVACHIIGLALMDGAVLRLLLLQYDETYRERLEEAECSALSGGEPPPRTNRLCQRSDRVEPALPLDSVKRVSIGGREFTVDEGQCSLCDSADCWELALAFLRFLERGWDPAGIDTQRVEDMFLTALTLEGEFAAIPELDVSGPIRFSMNQTVTAHPVELPVKLTVGAEYPDRLYFSDKRTGERHWAQINSVELRDMLGDFERQLNSAELEGRFTPEEKRMQLEAAEKSLADICPRGMRLPVIEYECEEGLSLQFFDRLWLDSSPERRESRGGFGPGVIGGASSIAIIMSPDKPNGRGGGRLQACVIQTPVPAGAETIDAELFRYHSAYTADDIVI